MIHLLSVHFSSKIIPQNGFTAEIIALKAGQKEAHRLLEEERLTAPAQLVYTEADRELNIWIGDQVCTLIVEYTTVQ